MVFAECMAASGAMAWLTLTLLIIIGVFLIAFIILTLIHQGMQKRWGWFVFTLIFFFMGLGLLIALLYWIIWGFSPKFRRKK